MAVLTPNSRPNWSKSRSDLFRPLGFQNAAKISLPDGKFIAGWNKLYNANVADQLQRGGTKFIASDAISILNKLQWIHSIYLGNAGVPSAYDTTPGAVYGAQNMSEANMRLAARTIQMGGYESDELGEGAYSCTADCIQREWYLSERQIMHQEYNSQAQANGQPLMPYKNTGNYGGFGIFAPRRWDYIIGGPVSPTDPRILATMATANAARSEGYMNHDYKYGVGANIKNYVDWDEYADTYYLMAYAAERLTLSLNVWGGVGQADGDRPLVYIDWGNKEGLGYPFGIGYWNRPYKDGFVKNRDFYSHLKVDQDYLLICNFMIGLLRMQGIVAFDVANTFGIDPSVKNNEQTYSGSSSNAPTSVAHQTHSTAFFEEPDITHDARMMAGELYYQTRFTEGVAWQPLAYRFEGSETWYEVAGNPRTEILYRGAGFGGPYDKSANPRRGRPDVWGRIKNGVFDLAEADTSKHKWKRENLIVRLPNGSERLIESKGMTLRTYSGSL